LRVYVCQCAAVRHLTWDGTRWLIYTVTTSLLNRPSSVTRVSQSILYVADPSAHNVFRVRAAEAMCFGFSAHVTCLTHIRALLYR
jgi:hypothetical protein